MSDIDIDEIVDDEMARAIAESLETFKQGPSTSKIVIDDDQFDEDLERALAASRMPNKQSSSPKKELKSTDDKAPDTSKSTLASDFLKQRALLEKERLARSKKRSYSPAESDDESDEPVHVSKKPTRSSNTPSGAPSTDEGDVFWNGEIRQTANRVTQSTDTRPTFRISEIIGNKHQVSFAILSSYCNMVSWLYEFFLPETPVILISQPHEDGESNVKGILPNWIMTMPFLRGGRGCMHVKLMMIFYKSGRLRIAVPTANFVDYDWRDIENTVWVQDFPLHKTPVQRKAQALDFPGTLQMCLQKLNVPHALASQLSDHPTLPIQSVFEIRQKWNFSKVKVRLIPSMAGKHEGWDQVIRQGHVSLMKAVNDIGASSAKHAGKKLVLECQGSSIGTYSNQWLQEFYSSCLGISPEKLLEKSKASRSKMALPPIKILFPSLTTVEQSALGRDGGGTMFCREKQWNGNNFPRSLFHDSNSKRGPVLMHSKMILGLWKGNQSYFSPVGTSKKEPISLEDTESEPDEDEDFEVIEVSSGGWIYVGSHNFTPSAWGNLSGTSFTPILNITNYELGILIPFPDVEREAEKKANEVACWKRPPRKYVLGEDVPWMQDL